MALINLFFLVEYPLERGLIIKERGNFIRPSEATENDELREDNADVPNIKFSKALRIPGVLQYAISFFFIKFAFYGVYYWIPTYLQDHLGYSKDEAGNITSLGSKVSS